jgi:hypothetical protein
VLRFEQLNKKDLKEKYSNFFQKPKPEEARETDEAMDDDSTSEKSMIKPSSTLINQE